MSKICFLTIVGMPNVGKSTLLNTLVGEKIAAVSPKAQTTRKRIMGVLTKDDTQYVFLDTPGFLKAQNRLGAQMQRQIHSSLSDADCVIFVTEPKGRVRDAERAMLKEIFSKELPVVLAINKCDVAKEKDILPTIAAFSEEFEFVSLLPLSARNARGTDRLFQALEPFGTEADFLFPPDTLTDQPEREIASEFIRERLLCALSEEVPHGIAVLIERFEDERGHLLHIGAVICCEKASHKGIIIGKGGAMLKKIGTEARLNLEAFFQCKVDLSLFVKVKENWRESPALLREFGLEGEDS